MELFFVCVCVLFRRPESRHFQEFLPHVLVSGNPDGGGDCHGDLQGHAQALRRGNVQPVADEAEQEHRHAAEAEGQEHSGERDQL